MRIIDLKPALKYPIADPSWISKFAILVIVTILGITAPAASGYVMKASKDIAEDPNAPLPEWNDFVNYWLDGLRLSVCIMFYGIPALAAGFFALISIVGVINSADADTNALAAIFSGTTFACIIFFCVWILIVSLITPAVTVSLLQDSSWGACFNIGKVTSILKNYLKPTFIVILLMYGVNFIANSLGSVAIIGCIFTMPFAQLVSAHLMGQLLAITQEGPQEPVVFDEE